MSKVTIDCFTGAMFSKRFRGVQRHRRGGLNLGGITFADPASPRRWAKKSAGKGLFCDLDGGNFFGLLT